MHLKLRATYTAASTMTFRDRLSTYIFTQCQLVGKDGNGADVYCGVHQNGHPSVFIVSGNKMVATSLNDGSCKTLEQARAKAQYCVDHAMTRYWDDPNPMERYYNQHHDTPVLVA